MAKKVTVIGAASDRRGKLINKPKLRVCGYARVSTGSKAQAESYATQVSYFTEKIGNNPLWEFAGMYADEAATGTKVKGREEFQAMIEACEDGEIDLILTKSVTRFVRNTVECIQTIRKLRALGVGILFEKENINTLTEKSELMLSILFSIAQGESEDFAGNNRWSIEKRFQDGTFITGTPAYGYRNDENGNLVIVEEEAKNVRWIFESYLNDLGTYVIAKELDRKGIPPIRTGEKWHDSTVKDILKNEKYMGDALLQKTYTVNFMTKKKVVNNGIVPQYYVEDDHEAIIPKELLGITEEWLNCKAKTARKYSTVFYRGAIDEELDLSGFPKSSRDNIKVALEKQVLVISLGAKLKIGKCKAVRDWFLANEFADFGDPFTNFFMSRRLPKGFVNDKDVQQKVVEYFASFDEHIKDFRIEKIPQEGESKEERYKINALHKMIDSDEMAEISLGLESAGTLKMFALYPELQEVMEKGSVFFIDELNARLHPLLVRNILITFLNPEMNINHAQLVFTTHDTWQLSNQLLRRDEIWFVEKDERGVSTLYSLADFVDEDGFRIRKDESYEKNYLIGKYGAIPTLKSIDIFKED